MDYFNSLTQNYIDRNTINDKNNLEDFYVDSGTYKKAIETDVNYSLENSKFFSNYRIPLNTTLMADSLVSRFDNGDTDFFPELALMFLKTYAKEIFRDNLAINPQNLVTVFNKNQELVELPYPVILLLGGLYYFQENPIVMGDQSPDKLFDRINHVKTRVNDKNIEVYNHPDLYRKPGTYDLKESNLQNRVLTFPSVRLLNRSLQSSNLQKFKIKTNVNEGDEVIEDVNIRTKSIIPALGYGIQNKFLNYYNKTLFGDYLNGSKTVKNDGLANVLAGGYTGILKPIKTYDSDEFEFTAFYRNLNVSDYSYSIQTLVTELDAATKNLKKLTSITSTVSESNENNLKIAYTKAFLVYSKLKASFLSGDIGTEENLKEKVTLLCDINNITSEYNIETSGDKLTDFYFLVSHIFFTSFHRVDSEIKKDLTEIQPFDLKYRLNFGKNSSEIYQKSAIGDDLYNILNLKNSTKLEQIDSLTEFLFKIWTFEKINLKQNYRLGSKSTFAIYPSAGGFISPNTLLLNKNKESLILKSSDRLIGPKPGFLTSFGKKFDEKKGKLGLTLNKSGKQMVDAANIRSGQTLTQKLGYANPDDPKVSKFLMEGNFDRVSFLGDYCFNNHSILNNTTRFFWFENNSLGDNLKLDGDSNGFYYETESGLIDAVNTKELNLNYLRSTNLGLFEHEFFKTSTQNGYNSNYDFNRLMDSINIEKLIDFSEEFKNFARIVDNNNNKFNLNSLIKASTVIRDSEFEELTTKTNFKLSPDDISLLLIGNSMYNYEFINKCDLSKYLNIALTKSQKVRCEKVVTEFTTNITTVANKSAIDSVTKLGDFQLSIHNFHSSPEVLFTNTRTYEELKSAIQGNISDLSFNKLIARRILFGEQYVPPYTELTPNDISEIKLLNKSYLYSQIHHPIGDAFDIRNNRPQIAYYNNYYVSLVKSFFSYLNIRYTRDNYKQLLKLLRGYSYSVSLKINILNPQFLPNSGIINENEYFEYIKKIITSNTIIFLTPIQESELSDLANEFFTDYNKTTFESIVSGLNGFLDRININISNNSQNGINSSFTEENEKESVVNEFKKTTYYNVKSLFDKVSTAGFDTSTERNTPNVFIPSNIDEIKNIDISDYINKSNLFYNYSINPNLCFDGGDVIENNPYDLYEIFQVVDRGNNDIGSRVLADLAYLYTNLYTDFDKNPNPGQQSDVLSIKRLTNSTVQNLFSGLAQTGGFLFQQIPNYLNINGYLGRLKNNDADSIYDLVDELFGVHSDTSLLGSNRGTAFGGLTGFPGYIFQLGTLSSKLSETQRTEQIIKNDSLNSFCLDVGYDNNREVSVKAEDAPDEILRSNVTSFTVDFGKQNQQMFNSVQLDSSEFYDTEESIRAWVDIVNGSQQTVQSSNIFPILEKRSYSCTVTGLGNATIQPLSYFYLRNVPLFHGTYWITNVSHDIRPNTMLTTFKGVRQPISSKIDIRKQLLYLFKENAIKLKNGIENANIIQTEGIPDTNGRIFLVPDNLQSTFEDSPYGYVLQKTNNNMYYKFNGIDIIASYIVSVTGTDDYNAASMGLINVLYNQSSAFTGNNNHADVIKNMKNIVIGIMNEKADLGDTRYNGSTSKNASLSKLVKENTFSTSRRLYGLLSEISASFETYKKDDLIKLDINEKVFSVKLNNQNDFVDKKLNQVVDFSMDSEINTLAANQIPISELTFFIEESDKKTRLNTKIDGISTFSEDNDIRNDIFKLFGGFGGNGQINELNKPIKIIRYDNKHNFVKFLGAYSSGKVAFFTSNKGGDTPYGQINWTNVIKNKYKLSNATQDELSNQFVPRTLGTVERGDFITNLIQIANSEYDSWGAGILNENQYDTNPTVKTSLDRYWSTVESNVYPFELPKIDRPWSAPFINYIIKTGKPSPNDFKYSKTATSFIIDIRGGNRSWKSYESKNTPLQIGDLLCYAKNGQTPININLNDFQINQDAHCDCVVGFVGEGKNNARLIGGDLNNSVMVTNVNLNQNGTVNDKNRTIILRFEPVEISLNNQTSLGKFGSGYDDIINKYGEIGDNTQLTRMTFPYPMYYDKKLVKTTTVHKLIKNRLEDVFNDILNTFGEKRIKELGLDQFGGLYNIRNKRSGNKPSIHSWALAIDLHPSKNQLNMKTGSALFSQPQYKKFIDIWYKHGFKSFGRELGYDWMHFQVDDVIF
jgi:hypothetical protein